MSFLEKLVHIYNKKAKKNYNNVLKTDAKLKKEHINNFAWHTFMRRIYKTVRPLCTLEVKVPIYT